MQNFNFSTGRVGSIPRSVCEFIEFWWPFYFQSNEWRRFHEFECTTKIFNVIFIVNSFDRVKYIVDLKSRCQLCLVMCRATQEKKWRFVLYIQCRGEEGRPTAKFTEYMKNHIHKNSTDFDNPKHFCSLCPCLPRAGSYARFFLRAKTFKIRTV